MCMACAATGASSYIAHGAASGSYPGYAWSDATTSTARTTILNSYTLDYGQQWDDQALTYSFYASRPSVDFYYLSSSSVGFQSFDSTAKQSARDILSYLSSFIDLNFTETSSGGDFRFGTHQMTPAGYAFFPGGSRSGEIWIDAGSSMAVGNYFHSTLIHEIGHALGLTHTFEVERGSNVPNSLDSSQLSVMSYDDVGFYDYEDSEYYYAQTYRPLDVKVLSDMYGEKSSDEDNTFRFTEKSGTTFKSGTTWNVWTKSPFLVVDTGGYDTLDMSGITAGHNDAVVHADLNLGGGVFGNLSYMYVSDSTTGVSSTIGTAFSQTSYLDALSNRMFDFEIYDGSTIERFILTSGNDDFAGTTNDEDIYGGAGNDRLTGRGGNDELWGEAGTDTAAFAGAASNYAVRALSSGQFAIYGEGIDLLDSIELLAFSDGTVSASSLATTSIQSITGSSANDSFTNTAGAQQFTGGTGTDWVSYSASFSQFSVAKLSADCVMVADSGGLSGGDIAYQVERFGFSDGTLAFDTDAVAGQAYRVYQAAFDRIPDVSGLGYWIREMDAGSQLATVAMNFLLSAEFQLTYGSPGAVSNSAFVTLLYNNVLDRNPDTSGLAYWLNEMSSGFSRERVLASFSESSENKANVADLIANGIWYT